MNDTITLLPWPVKIAEKELEIAGMQQKLHYNKIIQARMSAGHEAIVIKDETLRNEAQRKVALTDRLEADYQYVNITADIFEAEHKIKFEAVQLTLLQNEFAVAKLLMRERIAMLEIGGK